ncbi:MAG: DUF4062 domain-containing protein [Candidatus Methylomirabilales bacterium]
MVVFISSTYRDLAEYREVIRLALETSGYTYRGMEHFPPQDEPPLDVCLRALEECDVYVGIVGGLYGSSPPGRVLSYTELEYRHATSLGIYRIMILLDDNARVRAGYVEQDPERIERLNRFRARIVNNHTAQTFRDGHEAAWKILAALRIHEVRLREQEGNNQT